MTVGDTGRQPRRRGRCRLSMWGVLIDYYDAVRAAAFKVIDDMSDEDLSQSFTRGKRSVTWSWILGHVLVEEAQHLGQVGFIRGMIRGLNG